MVKTQIPWYNKFASERKEFVMNTPINILATLDGNYVKYFTVMLSSLADSNPGEYFEVYILRGREELELSAAEKLLTGRGAVHQIEIAEDRLADAPTTDRYPREMYYRIFAAKYLPDTLDRILYLDPDLIVNGSLRELYDTPMGDNYFAAASHIGKVLTLVNELRLDMPDEGSYINSGVMLINLALLRRDQDIQAVFDYIEAHRGKLILPDQDIISGLYGDRIIQLDPYRYNMTERLFVLHRQNIGKLDVESVRERSAIIHYCGRNKPWKSSYIGKLGVFYDEALSRAREKLPELDFS